MQKIARKQFQHGTAIMIRNTEPTTWWCCLIKRRRRKTLHPWMAQTEQQQSWIGTAWGRVANRTRTKFVCQLRNTRLLHQHFRKQKSERLFSGSRIKTWRWNQWCRITGCTSDIESCRKNVTLPKATDWREAIIAGAAQYKSKRIMANLPFVYDEYLFRLKTELHSVQQTRIRLIRNTLLSQHSIVIRLMKDERLRNKSNCCQNFIETWMV